MVGFMGQPFSTPLSALVRSSPFSRKWLVEQMGVARITFDCWMSGRLSMPKARVEKLAELLGVPEKKVQQAANASIKFFQDARS